MNDIRSHTCLRGIAALLVAGGHYIDNVGSTMVGGWPFDPGPYYLAVDFFFILSGFIMAMMYQDWFAASVKWKAYSSFLVRRLVRVWPLHILTMLLVIWLNLKGGSAVTEREILTNILLSDAWGLSDQFTLNAPSWSISCELAAYLVFPFFIFLCLRSGGWRLAAGVSGLTYLAIWLIGGGSLFSDGIDERIILLRILAAFPLGMALTLIPPPKAEAATALQAGAFAALGLVLVADLADVLTVPALALLTWSTCRDGGVLGRLARFAPLTWLGDVSYGVYMIHWPVMLAMHGMRWQIVAIIGPGLLEPVSAAIYVVIVVCAAAVSWRWFEMPLRAAVRRRPAEHERSTAGRV